MPYNAGATKAMKAMKATYGSDWAHVYYGLANKRAGSGLRGAHRGHVAANAAYAKGSKWGGKGKSGGSRRGRGHLTVRARGRTSVTRRRGGASVHVRIH